MNLHVSLEPIARHPFGRTFRSSCLGLALLAAAAGLCAAGAIADAPQMDPAPLLDKPLPTSVVDSVDEQPSPQHVYLSGHWTWRDGAFAWEAGHWELPPSPSAVWVAPQWSKQDNGYELVPGFWQEGAPVEADGQVAESAGAKPETSVVIEEAPPPPEREVIVARPSPSHVWLGGYWTWRAGRHVWVSGRWDLPPRPNVVWIAPRWERRGHGYVFVSGCWRDAGYRPRTSVVIASDGWRSDGIITIAPPPPPRFARHSHRPHRPSYAHVWVDGYWVWHGGRHVWIGGCWQRPPRGHRHWVAPRWERRKGGYIFIEGRWR